MKRYITIDGGTTNTRVNLVEDGNITATKKISRGARAGIDDRDGLKNELRSAISAILEEKKLSESDITRILASGMITSEFGLYELPHLEAPAGIKELHDSMAEVSFPEISSIPFVFIRGIRVVSDSLSESDMMRGEETELVGLMTLCNCKGGGVYVLPGSHSKIISIDGEGKICSFATMLTGEMIMALSQNTILKDAVDIGISDLRAPDLKGGYLLSKREGLNKILFKLRIMKNILKYSPDEVYSFFVGAVLADEIDYILSLDTDEIIIGGNQRLKNATATLLRGISEKSVTVISDIDVERSTAIGAITIYEFQED